MGRGRYECDGADIDGRGHLASYISQGVSEGLVMFDHRDYRVVVVVIVVVEGVVVVLVGSGNIVVDCGRVGGIVMSGGGGGRGEVDIVVCLNTIVAILGITITNTTNNTTSSCRFNQTTITNITISTNDMSTTLNITTLPDSSSAAPVITYISPLPSFHHSQDASSCCVVGINVSIRGVIRVIIRIK